MSYVGEDTFSVTFILLYLSSVLTYVNKQFEHLHTYICLNFSGILHLTLVKNILVFFRVYKISLLRIECRRA